MAEYELSRFSQRLSWASSPNAIASSVARKKAAGEWLTDLTVSNPTAVLDKYPHAAIAGALAAVSDFSYLPDPLGAEKAREHIANYYRDRGESVPPQRLLLTASTSEAYSLLFKLLCNAGEEVLAPVPSYPLFEYLAALDAVTIRPYHLLYDGSWFLDRAHLEAAISPSTRAIVLVNPNNPTGSVLNPADMALVHEIAQRHDIALIQDEVFADYPLAAPPSTACAPSPVLTFRLNGLSKAAGMPQMKLGWILVDGPAHECEAALSRLELIADTYLSVGTPVQQALGELLAIGSGIHSELLFRARKNLEAAKAALEGSSAHCLHTQAGWSVIVQFPRVISDDQLCTTLIENHQVIVQPGFFFDMPSGTYAVVSLITQPDQFIKGLSALRSVAERL